MRAADAAAIRAGLLASAMALALACGPARAQESAAAADPAAACAGQDQDRDGVNQCLDKCPASQAGQAIGPDGCAIPVAIDLRGVNFDYNDASLRPEAMAALDEAALLLAKYPQLRVEVASHTDSVGTREYNQRLSERRARAVYDYLLAHGVEPARLLGPHGYGESRPIAPNTLEDGSDNPEGRAKNRRTELNVQE
jgi:OOP family OmpA-OmpF porin